jgi:hypothetical protein
MASNRRLSGKDDDTIAKCRILAETHVIPLIGARKLFELSVDDVDRWLADRAKVLATRPLTWSHVDLDGDPANEVPPHIMVWRSVRAGG